MPKRSMATFWDARAREDAFYFVDNRRGYRDPETERFWASGETDLTTLLTSLGLTLTPDQTVLDVGCGPGRLTRAIGARVQRATGLDVSTEMLALARRHHGERTNLDWVQGDGTSLRPLPDASFDAVISHVVFQHIPDPQITLGYVAEFGRVLRPGGWAAFQISNDPRIHRRRPASPLHRLRAAVRRARRRGPRGQADPAWLGSAVQLDALRATAAAAGLEIERIVGAGTQYCLVRVRRR